MRSDHLCIVRAFETWENMIANKGKSRAQAWCRSKFLSWSTLQSIKRTRKELLGYLRGLGFLTFAKGGNGTRNNIDRNAKSYAMVLAALASGLWPNIATATPLAKQAIVANLDPNKCGRKAGTFLP